MAKKGHHKHKGRETYHDLLREARRGKTPANATTGPPYLSYDPAIEAERRAAQRGLSDTILNTKVSAKRARQDKRGQIKDIKVSKRRGVQDLRTDKRRTLRGIRENRQDVKLKSRRGFQDFNLQLQSLTRHFTQLGRQQTQVANAQGVLDEGTASAGASARAANQRIAEKPIHIGQRRLGQDTNIALQRIREQAGDTRFDFKRGLHRLKQDTHHDIHIARQDYRRTIFDLHTSLQQAIREQRIGDADLIQQEIYNARQNHIGSPSNYPSVNKGTAF